MNFKHTSNNNSTLSDMWNSKKKLDYIKATAPITYEKKKNEYVFINLKSNVGIIITTTTTTTAAPTTDHLHM